MKDTSFFPLTTEIIIFLQVVAVAIIVSLIFKKPSKMDVEIDAEFSSDQNQLKSDEELLHHPHNSGQGIPEDNFFQLVDHRD